MTDRIEDEEEVLGLTWDAVSRERDELRAENERLTGLVHLYGKRIESFSSEAAALRDVNKVLQLRGDTYLEQLEQKHAENKRLRAALKTIGSASDWHPDDMQAFARAACQA